MSKRIKRLALASLLSALSATLLIIGSVFEMLDLTVAALASVCVILAYVEMGTKYALCVWAVSSILSLVLLPSSAGIYFAMFLGFYPVFKIKVEKLKIEERITELNKVIATLSITVDDIAKVIEIWTGVPAADISAGEIGELAGLYERISSKIIGQIGRAHV